MSKKEATEKQAAVVEKEQLPAVQQANIPVVAGSGLDDIDLAADAGAGMQNVTARDIATPIIRILQSNSPQCKKSDAGYIAGAAEGMFFNNVTNEVFDGEDGLTVVPCFFEKVYIEWKPNRGGFVAIHPVDTHLVNEVKMVKNADGKDIPTLPNGNTLTETNQHYALILRDDGSYEPVVISMSSSNLRASRTWNNLMRKVVKLDKTGKPFTPASYYSKYKLTTKVRSDGKHTWYMFNVEPAGQVPSGHVYNAGKAFEQAVRAGAVKVKVDDDDGSDGHAPAAAPEAEAEDVPFE